MTESSAIILWFIAGAILIIAEVKMPSFILIFFGIGAWLTVIALYLDIVTTFNEQLLLFLISSIIALVLFRKKASEYFKGKLWNKAMTVDELENVKGKRAVVMTDILPNKLGGTIEFNGTTWKAESDIPLSSGTTVEIIERNNLTFKVKPI
jgi:membrane protein implicated in regulation of membrane protease activity